MERDYNQHRSNPGEKQGKSILSYLAQKNDRTMEDLKADINSLRKEVEELNDEIEVLEGTTNQPDNFMDFALEYSKRTAENLDEMIRLEFAEIEEDGKRISARHKQKIMELDAKMQKGIKYAYKIMNNMMEKTNQEGTPVVQPVIQPVVQPVKETKINKEEVYQERQPDPVQEAGDVKIIEGFWEEPKVEEKQKIETDIPVKVKEKENVTGIKNMYIIGKVAGEDLFDNSGKLIVAKNEVITEEIIDKAEKVGNLIELVLEMKLQEG